MDVVMAHLGRHVVLSEPARCQFASFVRSASQRVMSGKELIRPGERGKSLILVDGWIVREMEFPDGRRQITALFLPGDIFDLHADLVKECGYCLRAVTDANVAELTHSAFEQLAVANLELDEALTWGQLEQMANQTEWLANLGQLSAVERVAHFFCEVFWRLRAVGLTRGDECDMPLTQIELAEVLGVTPVHMNRSLKDLRERGFVELRRPKLKILDRDGLAELGLFDTGYLELSGKAR